MYKKFPSNIFGRIFFVANRAQWELDESTPPEIDVEKTFDGFLAERATPKSTHLVGTTLASPSQHTVKPTITDSPGGTLEPKESNTGVNRDPVAPEDAAEKSDKETQQ